MALPDARQRLTIPDRLAGLVGFTTAIVLLRLPFHRLTRIVALVKSRCRRLATPTEAETAVTAARTAGRWFPGRAACLENSLAAVLTAAVRGRSVDWCIGARLAPYAAHAWIQAGDTHAGEPDTPDRPYLLLLRI